MDKSAKQQYTLEQFMKVVDERFIIISKKLDEMDKKIDDNMISAEKVTDDTVRRVFSDCAQKHELAIKKFIKIK
jgi:hypothetical protein